MQVSIPEGERSCLCVLVVSILSISTSLISDFGIVQRASGADPGFQVRRGALKKIVEGGAKIAAVFRVKNHDFTPKDHIFSNFRGDAPGAPPPGSAPVCGMFVFQMHTIYAFDIKFRY